MIASPIAQFLTALMSMREQNRATGEYQGDSRQQIADALRIAGFMGPETLSTYDDSAGRGLTEFMGLRDRQQQGYQDRYNTAARDLQGYGQQAKADIDTNFAKYSKGAAKDWFGASVTPTVQANIEKERGAEQRRLGESLAGLRIGLLSGLSGDQLNADAMNTGNIAGWYGNNATNRSGIVNQGIGSMLNTLTGINLTPPAPNTIPFMAGANSVQAPSPPSPWASIFGGAAPGIGQGIGAGLTSWLLPKR
jgi:hypothetical protein